MKKIKQLYFVCLAAGLLGLVSGSPVWAFDGDDGGFDDTGEDHDGGEDQDEGAHHDKDGHSDGQGHHGGTHHHSHLGYGGGIGPGFGPGLGFGAFGYMPPFYPSLYYAYPLMATQPAPPPVYIQQQNTAQPAPQPPTNYWHYCQASEGYYPAVKECPDGWLQVAPQAQSDTQE